MAILQSIEIHKRGVQNLDEIKDKYDLPDIITINFENKANILYQATNGYFNKYGYTFKDSDTDLELYYGTYFMPRMNNKESIIKVKYIQYSDNVIMKFKSQDGTVSSSTLRELVALYRMSFDIPPFDRNKEFKPNEKKEDFNIQGYENLNRFHIYTHGDDSAIIDVGLLTYDEPSLYRLKLRARMRAKQRLRI